MDIKNVRVTELRPTVGHWITSKVIEDESKRFFSDFIILAQNDSAGNYEEWTDAQKVEWEAAHQPEHFEEVENPTENIVEIGESTTSDLQI